MDGKVWMKLSELISGPIIQTKKHFRVKEPTN